MKTFAELESKCSLAFAGAGPFWHLWTPENHPVILADMDSFKSAMNIIAICVRLVPGLVLITFQIMTNHLHLTFAGSREEGVRLFCHYQRYLARYLKSRGHVVDLSSWKASLRQIETLQDLRNVITYNNRNGYVVSPDETPFTYPWGANSYYFNYHAKARYKESRMTLNKNARRALIHSHDADRLPVPIVLVDGYACPMDFCSIESGEGMFRCASHYFREISRNIESQRKIAGDIGESVFYTDEELFGVVLSICKEKYGGQKPTLLPAKAKEEVALLLHNDYHAGNKQIQRMLRLDATIISALFPIKY